MIISYSGSTLKCNKRNKQTEMKFTIETNTLGRGAMWEGHISRVRPLIFPLVFEATNLQ
jgi:hypothetical protein